jgi:transcriptional regulator with XRE-family HTH domain
MLWGMSTRRNLVDEARRRARRQLDDVIRDLRNARLAAGLSQAAVGYALGISRSLLAGWERGELLASPLQLAGWGAVVGLDVPIRAHAAGSPLRDVAQLRILERAHLVIGDGWDWQTEVPVSSDPLDRRAVDVVLRGPGGSVGLEVISRLTDAQGQIRAVVLKQQVSRIERMVLVLADTRHNRNALMVAAPTVVPAFPLRTRAVLVGLRAGRLPRANGVILI